MSVPQELLDLLQAAEDLLSAAKDKDNIVAIAQVAVEDAEAHLVQAENIKDQDTDEALAAHQAANQKAQEALDALKQHFGLVPPPSPPSP